MSKAILPLLSLTILSCSTFRADAIVGDGSSPCAGACSSCSAPGTGIGSSPDSGARYYALVDIGWMEVNGGAGGDHKFGNEQFYGSSGRPTDPQTEIKYFRTRHKLSFTTWNSTRTDGSSSSAEEHTEDTVTADAYTGVDTHNPNDYIKINNSTKDAYGNTYTDYNLNGWKLGWFVGFEALPPNQQPDTGTGPYTSPPTTKVDVDSNIEYYPNDGSTASKVSHDETTYSDEYAMDFMEGKAQNQADSTMAAQSWAIDFGLNEFQWATCAYATVGPNALAASIAEGQCRFFLVWTDPNCKYTVHWWLLHRHWVGDAWGDFSWEERVSIPTQGTGGSLYTGDAVLKLDFPAINEGVAEFTSVYWAWVEETPNSSTPSASTCSTCSANGNLQNIKVTSGPNLTIPLGNTLLGASAGTLKVAIVRPQTATPLSVTLSTADSSVIAITSAGALRQVLSAQYLVDIISNSPCQFDVNVYDTNHFTRTLNNGVYVVDSGNQFVNWRVQNPGGANDTNNVTFSESRSGHTIVNSYSWTSSQNSQVMQAVTGNGLKKETWTESWNTNVMVRTVVYELRNSTNQLVYTRTDTYNGNYASLLSQRVEGVGGEEKTTSYTYDHSRPTGYSRSDGTSENYQYNPTNGLLVQKSWASHYIMYDYTPLGYGDNGSFQPRSPRSVAEYCKYQLGDGSWSAGPISWHKYILTPSMRVDMELISPDANGYWDASSVLCTTNFYDANLQLTSTIFPDNTVKWYTNNVSVAGQTNTVLSGYISGNTYVTNKIDVTVTGPTGLIQSKTTTESGVVTARATYSNYDGQGRVGQITYLDGTWVGYKYDCCGLSAETNRDGLVTTYAYDDLKRLYSKTEAWPSGNITWNPIYDAMGREVAMKRQGQSSPLTTIRSTGYNTSGYQVSSTDAMTNTTWYSQSMDGNLLVNTTTYPNQSTRVEELNGDGSLSKLTGTAVNPMVNDFLWGWNSFGSGLETTESKLDDNGKTTGQWTTTYVNLQGQTFYVYDGNGITYSYYNNAGQLWKTVDPDNVTTFYTYNSLGEREYTIAATTDTTAGITGYNSLTNGISGILSGSDRVSRSERLVLAGNGSAPDRIQMNTYVWKDAQSGGTLISSVETSTDGLWERTTTPKGVSVTVTTWNGTQKTVTTTYEDLSTNITVSQCGQLVSQSRFDTNGTQIALTAFGYDDLGRQNAVGDVRTGTTSYTFNNADQPVTVTTPIPGSGMPAQTTTTYYNNMGQVAGMMLPDGTWTTNFYTSKGELQKTSGSRTYPVAYTYDSQGRMLTMTTWTNFLGNQGQAITTWAYDNYGRVASKTYNDGKGITYGYYPSGRLNTRTGARGYKSTYHYTTAGDLSGITYDDNSLNISKTYDRLGRLSTASLNSMTDTYKYNDAGLVTNETYSGGTLGGMVVTNGYDSLLRRTNLWVNTSPTAALVSYTYDAASRLSMVSNGICSAKYSYLANSPLVSTITLAQTGTTRMTTTKTWDNLNRLTGINSKTNSVAVTTANYLYNSANQRTKCNTVDGSYWVYGYDSLGQVTGAHKFWVDGTPVAGQQFDYTFDDIGNRRCAWEGGNGAGEVERRADYTANLLNQYTQRTVPAAVDIIGAANSNATVTVNNQPTQRKADYYWDQFPITNGVNPVWVSVTNFAVLNNGSNPDIVTTNIGFLFAPKTPEALSYDDDGNLLSDGRWTYTWDVENRLTGMAAASTTAGRKERLAFEYDWQGRRIHKQAWTNWNGSTGTLVLDQKYVYDGWNLIAAITTQPSSSVQTYAWGLDLSGSEQGAGGVGGLLLANFGTSGTNFVSYDGNGNVLALVDAVTGTNAALYEYDPFGKLIRATGPLAKVNPFRFSTKFTDDETDLVYYGYRYYNPSTGRWTSRDPAEEQEGGLNLYGFTGNNPISYVDLLGLQWEIHRLGRDRAMVYPECGDTVVDLARRIGLDPREYRSWLKAEDYGDLPLSSVVPLDNTRLFSIPNKVLFVIGGDINRFSYDIIIMRAMELLCAAEQYGYSVKFMDYGTSAFTKADVLTQKRDLHGFMFFGHGEINIPIISPTDNPGQFVIEKQTWQEISAPEMIDDSYHYGVVLAKFCSSSLGHWSSDASLNGLGEVTLGTVTTPVMPPFQVWRLKSALRRESGK